MDWWVGALALIIVVFGGAEIAHAFEIIGDPIAAIAAIFRQLWGLLPW